MKLTARILGIVFALLIFVFITRAPNAIAQETTNNVSPILVTNTNPNVPNNLHNWMQTLMIESASSLICQLTGRDIINQKQACLGIDSTTGKIGFVNNGGGAISVMAGFINSAYLIPVHTDDFIANAVGNFGLAKTAHAQNTGMGFTGLTPVLGLFTIFRNLSYLLMMLIFVIVGITIMLRLKIDPRTVMTIQNQIPKLIIGLIMITFSYAIAGLLIDAMWVSNFMIINTLTPSTEYSKMAGTGGEKSILTQSVPGFTNDLFGGKNGGILGLSAGAAGSVGTLVHDVIASDQVSNAMNANSSQQGCWFLGCIVDSIMNGFWHIVAGFIGFVASIVVFFIFVIAIIVALFRLWFALLKCFINVLIGVILGPLWILGGLIPGASNGLGWTSWLKHLVGNLAPYPAIVFLFLVAKTIMNAVSEIDPTASTFNPPLLGNVTTGDNQTMYGALIAVGFILAAPSVVEKVKKAFGTGGSGLGIGGLGTGQAALAGLAGGVASRMYYKDPRTGQVKGVVGARIQRFSIGTKDEGTGKIRTSTLQRATGFATRAPSAKDYATSMGVSETEAHGKLGGKTIPSEKPTAPEASDLSGGIPPKTS